MLWCNGVYEAVLYLVFVCIIVFRDCGSDLYIGMGWVKQIACTYGMGACILENLDLVDVYVYIIKFL